MVRVGDSDPGAERLKVSVADYAVDDGRTLTTSGLGSCLGIALYAPEAGRGGLVHPMLPTRADSERPRERFVDSGIRLLLEELDARGREVEAKLVGGATIIGFENETDGSVGERNVGRAREVLEAEGVDLAGQEVGGDSGRSMRFDIESGRVFVQRTDGVETVL